MFHILEILKKKFIWETVLMIKSKNDLSRHGEIHGKDGCLMVKEFSKMIPASHIQFQGNHRVVQSLHHSLLRVVAQSLALCQLG